MKREIEIPEGYEARIEDNKVIIEQKESDDERIRKALIRMLSAVDGGYPFEKYGILKKDAISYLEKQKEQKPAEKLSKEEYVKKFKALCDAYEIKLPNREYDIYGLCDDLSKLSMDSGNQKSVEWSEKDDEIRKALIAFLEMNVGYFSCNGFTKYEIIQWLKSLPERFNTQPKQERGKEDERKLNRIYEILGYAADDKGFLTSKCIIGDKEAIELQDFLRSIVKPRTEWSEEDKHCIELLDTIIDSSALIPKNRIKCHSFLKFLRPQSH